MGAKHKRRRQFLADNPLCCFCGGTRVSEEIDHIPSRVLFKNRQWPEGFEFPACSKCNRATSLDEQVVAMLSLVTASTTDPSIADLIQERMQAIANNLPELFIEMNPTTDQLREAASKYTFPKSQKHPISKLPVLSVRGPLVNSAIANFGRKLACALYYKHTHRIASPDAQIALRWYTNLQIDNNEIPRELADILVNFPVLRRAKISLDDQFFYRWAVSETESMGVFLAFFRNAFAILSFINTSKESFSFLANEDLLSPYSWD